QHCGDLVVRALVELGERLPALGGEAEADLSPVGGKRLSTDQPLLVETLDDAAEIAGVEAELDADFLCREVVAMGQFVKHPRLAQRERAFCQMLVQHPELARIEAVEGADCGDLAVGFDY